MATTHKRPLCYGKKYGPPTAVAEKMPNGRLTKLIENIKKAKQTTVDVKYTSTKLPTVPPKLPMPAYKEDLDGYGFDDFVKWYRANGWTDEDIEWLYAKRDAHEASIAGKNAHLDKVLSRYNGKTSTSTKVKPLRTRFKVKSIALQVDDEEVVDEGVVQDSEL